MTNTKVNPVLKGKPCQFLRHMEGNSDEYTFFCLCGEVLYGGISNCTAKSKCQLKAFAQRVPEL